MDKPIQEEDPYLEIRQTIRNVMVPLAQAIIDDKPEDIMLFCSNYFNDHLKKRYAKAEDKDTENMKFARDNIQKKTESIKQEYNNEESKKIETNVQGSASDPVLRRDKLSNLRGTSSWDTPSNLSETRSRADFSCNLTDAGHGIGDQLQKISNQTGGLEMDIKAGDKNSSMKDDRVFGYDISENVVSHYDENDSKVEGDVKVFYFPKKGSEENIKILGSEFERKKTFQISEPLNLEDPKPKDCDFETNQSEGIQKCRKQLSPNSSFGFIPHLDESEEEMKNMNFGDSENAGLTTQSEEIMKLAQKISVTFHNLACELNSAETNFNDKLQNAKEISDVIEARDVTRKMNLDMIPDQNIENGSNFIDKEIKSDSEKTLDENSCEKKTSNENIASAYPHNIPYSWRKLFKQSCSSESSTNFNKEPLSTLTDKRVDFMDCTKEEGIPLYNARHVSETDVTDSKANNSETLQKFQNEKENSGRKIGSSGHGDHSEEDISVGFKGDQNYSIQSKRSSENDSSTSTNDKNNSEKYPKDQELVITDDQNTILRDEKGEMEEETENFDRHADSTDAHDDKTIKGVVGLNAACGDFVSANNNVRNTNTHTSAADTKDNNENDEGISAEYVGEVIERVMEENKLQDSMDSSYECLNFSCYSESDSSYCESSDLSENDDTNV